MTVNTKTTEVKITTHIVGGKKYIVGTPVKLTAPLVKLLKQIRDIGKQAEKLNQALYREILSGQVCPADAPLNETTECRYFVEYMGLEHERKFLLSTFNRKLFLHVGGQLPVRLELDSDKEPMAIVREFEAKEEIVSTALVSRTMGITSVGSPALDMVQAVTGLSRTDIEPAFEAWRIQGTMVFSSDKQFTPVVDLTSEETFRQSPIIAAAAQCAGQFAQGAFPYILICFGERLSAAGVDPNINFSPEIAQTLYAFSLQLAGSSPDSGAVLNVFSEVVQGEENKPSTIVTVMYHIGVDGTRSSGAARYKQTEDGLQFIEYWDSARIAESAAQIQAANK